MPTQVLIENFQCHRSLSFSLPEKGVVALIGETDSGKSAVLRALGWLFFNRPIGFSFLGPFGKECRVSMELPNSTRIERIRGPSKNCYVLSLPKQEEPLVLSAVGNEVPEEVRQILPMHPILNVQWQHDPPFMLRMSPGERSRLLNEATDAAAIDRAIQFAKANEARAKEAEAAAEEDHEKAKADLARFARLPQLLALAKSIEARLQAIEKKRGGLDRELQQWRQLALLPALKVDPKRLIRLRAQAKRLEATILQRDAFAETKRRYEYLLSLLQREGDARQLLDQIRRSMPQICPTCKRPLAAPRTASPSPAMARQPPRAGRAL